VIFPDKERYIKDSGKYSIIPVFKEIRTDFDTPVSIFHKVGGDSLLESVESGENVGRYSFITVGRITEMRLDGRKITITEYSGKEDNTREYILENPFDKIREYFNNHKVPQYEGLPPLFGGALGYLGFETVRYFEKVPVKEKSSSGIPDGILITPKINLVYDMVKRSVTIVVSSIPGDTPGESYGKAAELIGELIEKLKSSASDIREASGSGKTRRQAVRSSVSKEQFVKDVAYCKQQIQNGEIIQVVISRKFMIPTEVEPFSLYRTLRVLNPSPYLYYLDFKDFHLIGSSPEVMVRVRDGELLLKPIAGTRKRGKTISEDDRLAEELLNDPKEQAEHLMLVDLGRNDLGRIAVPGSVEVTKFMAIERYSHVMHIVSTIKADMDPKHDVFDVLKATFPAGTLSGAPKIRAMEIINEVEKDKRESYGGIILFMGFNGNLESCITIRTVLLKDGTAVIQSGAGIVADSVAESEFEETENKAMALIKSIEEALR